MPSAAEVLVDILAREGVEVVFGVPGGPLLPLLDVIARHPRMRFVLTRHEQGAAYAAYAYALASGRLGVCAATLGPGATNLIAGLPVARVESVPVLAITGEVQTTAFGHGAHQESTGWFGSPDQGLMYRAVCKHSVVVADASRLPDMTRHLIRIAHSPRPGPVHLGLPANLLLQSVEDRPRPPASYRLLHNRSFDPGAADRIAARIAAARAPALLLGGRARGPGIGAAAEALAAKAGMGLAVDLAAKTAVDERHPQYLGCIGVLGHKAAEGFLKSDTDLLITVGQTFDEISTLSWDPALGAGTAIVQIDTDAEEIGKVYPIADAAVGDLGAVLNALVEREASEPARVATRLARIGACLARHPLWGGSETLSRATPLKPPRVIAELAAALPADALLLSDSSKWARWLGRFAALPRDALLCAHDYEPMGWAVAGALGASFAHPGRPVFAMCGDGAFMMSAMELSVAAEHHLPIVWLVMNDARLGIIYDLQKGLFSGQVSATTYRPLDLDHLAQGLGLSASLVREPGDMALALATARERGGPHLVDVRFDPDDLPPIRPRSLHITKAMGLPGPTPGPETTRALFKMMKDR